jgi:hypothetical protein
MHAHVEDKLFLRVHYEHGTKANQELRYEPEFPENPAHVELIFSSLKIA